MLYQAEAVVSSEASASTYAFAGGSNPVIPYDPPTTQGVDDSAGLFAKTYTDISVPGLGPALDLTRTYDNVGGGAFMFGYDWTSSYGMETDRLARLRSRFVYQENGSPVTFTCSRGTCSTNDGIGVSLKQSGSTFLFTRGLDTFTFQVVTTAGSSPPYELTKITDANGHATTLAYNVVNLGNVAQLSTVTDAEGRTLTFTWNGTTATSTVTSVKDPMGRVTAYAYNSSDALTSVTQPGSQVTSFTYESATTNPQIKTITVSNGDVTSFTYDNCAPCGNTLATTNSITSITDPMGLVTTFAYSQNAVIVGLTPYRTDQRRGFDTELPRIRYDGNTERLNSSGSVVGSMTYDTFGTNVRPVRAEHYSDLSEVHRSDGLIYLINRYYDPAAGQFAVLVDPYSLRVVMLADVYTAG